jgi:hypothetical protein
MNKHIHLEEVQPVIYKFLDDKYRTTICKKTSIFHIRGEQYRIHKHGTARCNPIDKYDQEFGKALAWIRASKKIGNEVENILISYSARESLYSSEPMVALRKYLDKKLSEDIENIRKITLGLRNT